MTARTAPIAAPGRKRKPARQPGSRLSRKVKAAIECMVFEGCDRKTAAQRVGLTDHSMYQAFRQPAVVQHYNEQLQVLRTSERARNLHTGIELRDKSESDKVRLDAAKYLDGNEKSGVTVNVGVGVNVSTPGYVIDLSGYEIDGQIGSLNEHDAKPLSEADEVAE